MNGDKWFTQQDLTRRFLYGMATGAGAVLLILWLIRQFR